MSGWNRHRRDPPPAGRAAGPVGFPHGRVSTEDLLREVWDRQDDREGLRVLALSGGGAGGAFGAGALVGLSEGGGRPRFDVVTGVSTGALIAPFAFLGAEWDARLADAYTGAYAAELLALSGVRPGVSLYPAARLQSLVERYVDAGLLRAVGCAQEEGRRMFVTSANLDAQTTSTWDLGAIAAAGGPAALRLFKDVLIASASLPGVFPPKMIAVTAGGERFEEMHIDGGAVSPLFVPPALLRPAPGAPRPLEVFALVNTTLTPTLRTTPVGAATVLMRSFELMLRSSYCNAVESLAALCEVNGVAFRSASVPTAFGGLNMLKFDRQSLQRMFEVGADLGRSGQLWSRAVSAPRIDAGPPDAAEPSA